jgi:hypothetical protein
MRKPISLLLGLALGVTLGVALMSLFAPVSGDQFRRNLRLGWEAAKDDARRAAVTRRAELEADLARRRGTAPPALP